MIQQGNFKKYFYIKKKQIFFKIVILIQTTFNRID